MCHPQACSVRLLLLKHPNKDKKLWIALLVSKVYPHQITLTLSTIIAIQQDAPLSYRWQPIQFPNKLLKKSLHQLRVLAIFRHWTIKNQSSLKTRKLERRNMGLRMTVMRWKRLRLGKYLVTAIVSQINSSTMVMMTSHLVSELERAVT